MIRYKISFNYDYKSDLKSYMYDQIAKVTDVDAKDFEDAVSTPEGLQNLENWFNLDEDDTSKHVKILDGEYDGDIDGANIYLDVEQNIMSDQEFAENILEDLFCNENRPVANYDAYDTDLRQENGKWYGIPIAVDFSDSIEIEKYKNIRVIRY